MPRVRVRVRSRQGTGEAFEAQGSVRVVARRLAQREHALDHRAAAFEGQPRVARLRGAGQPSVWAVSGWAVSGWAAACHAYDATRDSAAAPRPALALLAAKAGGAPSSRLPAGARLSLREAVARRYGRFMR